MSEGPEVRWAADRLSAALVGEVIVDARFPSRPEVGDRLVGSTVTACDALGKNIILAFSGGLWLRTHMLMYGKWRTYPRAEFVAGRSRAPRRSTAYRKSARPDPSGTADVRTDRRVRLVLETTAVAAVQFNGPVLEFAESDPRRGEQLARLGPDALADDFDFDEAYRRLHERGESPLADLLLDQSFVAGVGNKYKAEILFILGVDPFRTASTLSAAEQRRVIETILKVLREAYANGGRTRVVPGMRATGRDGSLWVYGRAGRPCHRCGTVVRSDVRRSARRTYYCASCQAGTVPVTR